MKHCKFMLTCLVIPVIQISFFHFDYVFISDIISNDAFIHDLVIRKSQTHAHSIVFINIINFITVDASTL
jgi:hypothetical protein